MISLDLLIALGAIGLNVPSLAWWLKVQLEQCGSVVPRQDSMRNKLDKVNNRDHRNFVIRFLDMRNWSTNSITSGSIEPFVYPVPKWVSVNGTSWWKR